jgi:hypothetical protein
MIDRWLLNDVDAGYIQELGLFAELVLFPSGSVEGSARGSSLLFGTLLGPERTRECFPQRETTGRSPSSNRRSSDLAGEGTARRCLVVL